MSYRTGRDERGHCGGLPMIEAAQVAQEITPYIAAAVGAYGTAVLTRVEDSAADVSVSFGRRALQRIAGRRTPQDPPTAQEVALATTIAEMAANPADPDLITVLQAEIRRALLADPPTARELATWARPRLEASDTVTITAAGSRSVAAYNITGDVATGNTTAPTSQQ